MAERTVTAPTIVDIDLGERSYPVYIGADLLARPELFAPHLGRQVAIISNQAVANRYLAPLLTALQGRSSSVHLMRDGERYKSLAEFEAVISFLLEHRHDRATTLIALGGGVVGDLTGFSAACYQRGVPFLQVPTTLLAQVDSSVGGKTAVNHPSGKNMIGAFYQPRAVVADVSVLRSLPARELAAGMAEVIKYGVIEDPGFFEWLEANAPRLMALEQPAIIHAVRRSVEIKAAVVAADERENGRRAILNYGHTFAHAIETLTGYTRYLHGEAVAIGMVLAADLSTELGLVDATIAARLRHLLRSCGLPVDTGGLPPDSASKLRPQRLIETMGLDKKVQDGKLRFVLTHGLGQVAIHDDVERSTLLTVLRRALAHSAGPGPA